MNLYTLALFAHLLGILGMFVGMGLQWTITLRLRRAQTLAQVREWSSLVSGVGKLGAISGVVVLAAGIYLVVARWNFSMPWIVVSLAALMLMLALGVGVMARRLNGIRRAAATSDASSDSMPLDLQRRIRHPLLWIAAQLTGSIALGIVFLMTVKPDMGVSLLALAVALAFGSIAGVISTRRWQHPQAGPVTMKEHIA